MEPDNPFIREEIQKVEALTLELERQKLSKPARLTPPLPKPRTRRVPIEIVDAPPTTGAQDDLLIPLSSRPLDRSVATAPPIDIAPTPDTATAEDEQLEQKSPQISFRDAKQTRSAKYGGGIFRSSGSHTIFKPENFSLLPTRPQTDQPRPLPPMNLAAFTRSWNTLTTDKHKWALLQQIPPVSLSRFLGSSLEANILSSILGVLLTVLSVEGTSQDLVKEYMVFLPQVSRFFLIHTFLRRDDKDRVKEIWTLLDVAGVTGEDDNEAKKLWGV